MTETAKVQKIVHDCLQGEGRERVDGWVPRYMAFPVDHYDPNKTLQIGVEWKAVKALFTGQYAQRFGCGALLRARFCDQSSRNRVNRRKRNLPETGCRDSVYIAGE